MDAERLRRRFTPIRRRLCVGSGDGEVRLLELDAFSGRIDVASSARTGHHPSFLTFHPKRAVAYAAHQASAEVAALALGAARIGVLGRAPSGGDGPSYVSLDRTGSLLFVANRAGGTIAVLQVLTDGSLGELLHVAPCLERPQAIVVDPSNRFVFVPAQGSDLIYQFRLDRSAGKLLSNPRPTIPVRPGSGPRHLVFHPSRPLAYVTFEHTSEVACYELDPELGTLHERQVLSALPHAAGQDRNRCADLLVAPSGRFLYASNCGHDSVAVFGVRPDGTLSLLGHAAALGKMPQSLCVAASGEVLVVANLESNALTTFRVDTGSGVLTPLATTQGVPAPRWVGFF